MFRWKYKDNHTTRECRFTGKVQILCGATDKWVDGSVPTDEE